MQFSKSQTVSLAVALAIISLILTLYSIVNIQESWSAIQQRLQSNQVLIVLNYSANALPFVALILAAVTLVGANQAYLCITGKHNPKKEDRFTHFCSYFALACLVGLLIGRPYIDDWWDDQAKQQGYQPCPSMTLLKSSLTRTAWVRDENLCYDQQISKILRYGNERELSQIQAYLR